MKKTRLSERLLHCFALVGLGVLISTIAGTDAGATPAQGADCLGCHVYTETLPDNHLGFKLMTSEQCLMCHAANAEQAPIPTTHPKLDATAAQCLGCHISSSDFPPKHPPYGALTSEQCGMCHIKADGSVEMGN